MNKSELIKTRVYDIVISIMGVDESEVTPEANFTNDLGADSLDAVELIMEFEKEFNIDIPDEHIEKISTVGEAISYIDKSSIMSTPSDDINIYAASDIGKWCAAGYGVIKEPFDSPEAALKAILRERFNK